MKQKHNMYKAIVAIAVAMAFVMPVAAFANVGTFGVISNSENTGDMENMVEISTNSDASDNIETTSDKYNAKDTIVAEETIDNARSITGDTIYVDDDNTEGPWDGTWQYPYQYIQDGIDNADPGDTIYVFNGVYYNTEAVYEYVLVNKQLDLIGQSKNVILDGCGGGGTAVSVTANDVNISTFTITNGRIGVNFGKSNGHVTNCDVYNHTYVGISPGWGSSNSVVMDCAVYNNSNGIIIYNSPNSKLRGNTIYDNDYDFVVTRNFDQDIDTSNTINGKPMQYLVDRENITLDGTIDDFGYLGLISCTNITVQNAADVYGILLVETTDSTISNINCHDSADGIYFYKSSGNNITDCDAYDNNYGIYIYKYSNDNIITNCNSYNNSKSGIYIKDKSHNNIITDCTISYNDKRGIYLYKDNDKTNIINCDIYSNNEHGIYLEKSPNTNIINCNVYENSEYGIFLYKSTPSKLEDNTIYDNGYDFAISGFSVSDHDYDLGPSNTVDGKPIFYIMYQENLIFDGTIDNFGFLGLIACTNITVKNAEVNGILMVHTTDSTISNVDSHSSSFGIGMIVSSNNNIITDCIASDNNMYGIYIGGSSNNNIISCNSYNNRYDGIYIGVSSKNNITNCNSYNNSQHGIYNYKSSDNNIINCCAYNNSRYGIFFMSATRGKLQDSNVYDNGCNFGVEGTSTGNFRHDIDTSNIVDGKPLWYLLDQENMVLDGTTDDFGYLGLISCTNITAMNADVYGVQLADTTDSTMSNVSSHNNVKGIYLHRSSGNNIVNCNLYSNEWAIYTVYSSDIVIMNCNIYGNDNGFSLGTSTDILNCNVYNNNYGITPPSNSKIMNCNVYNNDYGIYLSSKSNIVITNCNIYENSEYGIYLKYSSNNLIHHNNFITNAQNAFQYYRCSDNIWDDGIGEGNYWSDYMGIDEDGDGIGDTPYAIPGYSIGQDNYPLMMILDDISPVITDVAVTPEVQKPGEPVNITCMVTDNWDMIDTVKVFIIDPYGFIMEATMNEGSYYYEDTYATMGVYYYYIWANDAQGNIAVSDTYSFVITDLDTPISAVDPLPTWNTVVPFTVTATAYDPTFSPGVVSVTLWYRYSSDGTAWTDWTSYGIDEEAPWRWLFTGSDGYYEFYSIAVDDYENVEEPPSTADASTGIDTTDPVTTSILDGTMGENDWYVSSVEITLSAIDEVSGIDSTWYQIDSGYWTKYTAPFTVSSEGEHTVEYYSFDRAVNREDTKYADFKIDKTPPATEHEFDGIIGDEGWFVSDVTVTLSATDTTSEVNYTKYKLDEGTWTNYIEPFDVTEDGEYTLYYYSVDYAGNEEDGNEVDFKIGHDEDPPVTTHVFGGITGDNGWYTSNVVVALSAEDDSSGVAYTYYKLDDDVEWTRYIGSFYVTDDAEHTLYYYSVDRVGNEEDKNEVPLKIDQTVPTIDLEWVDEDSKLVADVYDETSGVAKVEFYVNDEYVGEDTTSPYEWEVTKPKRGDKGQAIVYDNAGLSATSAQIDVVSQSQSQSSSSSLVSWPFSWLFGLW